MISPHHHEKRKIWLHFFGFLLFLCLIAVAVFFDKSIRTVIEVPRRMVAGEHDINLAEISKESFKEEIASDSKDVMNNVVNQAMHVTLADLVVMAKRTHKVLKDIDAAKNEFEDFVHSIPIPHSLPLNK